MGSTINPRARGGSSLSAELKASRADRGQIRRLFNPTPKPTPPAAGGSMQGFTRATPGTTTWGASIQPRDWSFDTGADASPGAKPGLVLGGDDVHFGAAEAGWYVTHHQMQFTIGSGSPTAALFQGNNMSMNLSAFGESWGHQHFDGRFRTSFWCGPFWLDVDSYPLGLEAFVSGAYTAGSVLATFVDVYRVG